MDGRKGKKKNIVVRSHQQCRLSLPILGRLSRREEMEGCTYCTALDCIILYVLYSCSLCRCECTSAGLLNFCEATALLKIGTHLRYDVGYGRHQ
jgi:hypothetical protein